MGVTLGFSDKIVPLLTENSTDESGNECGMIVFLKITAVDIGEPNVKQGAGRVDANNIVDAAGGDDDDGNGGEESTSQTVNESLSGGYDYASTSPNSQETITIDSPDISTALQVTVDSYSG